MARTYPLMLAAVPWSENKEYICGWRNGMPLLRRGCAPRDVLATFRQLRARGLRPGGRDHIAELVTKHRKSSKTNFSRLWLISDAVPVRPMTPAKYAALERAMTVRKTCRDCGDVYGRELPKDCRLCPPCREVAHLAVEFATPWSYIHDYLVGEPTLSAAEHAELDQQLAAERYLAPVIPLQREHRAVAVAERTAVSA
jgi:hypothetical protein